MSEIWKKIVSSTPITRIRQRSTFLKIATNTGWLIFDKLISIVAGLLVGAWVARYLGPAQYGTLNYAVAFVALFTPIAGLGLKDIVIRNIVKYPADKHEILGTAFSLQFLSSLLTLSLSIGIISIAQPADTEMRLLIAILSGTFVFQAVSNTLDYWFQSQIESKFSVLARNLALVVIASVKVGLILSEAPLEAFAWTALAQMAILALAMVVWYKLEVGNLLDWQISLLQVKQLLKDSWPLIISGLAVVIYMKVDQIMLGNMASEEELGIYSAAVRLSELWYFIPMAIASSFFPTIIRSREKQSEQAYRERIQTFFDLMAGTAYLIVIPTALLAPLIITTLFGTEYSAAGLILRIHIWAFIFVSLGVARSRWLMAENMTRFSMLATVMGAIVNIALNLWLIPRYAGLGAAWATLISQAVSAYLSTLLSIRLWSVFGQLSLSTLIPFRLFSFWRSFHKITWSGGEKFE